MLQFKALFDFVNSGFKYGNKRGCTSHLPHISCVNAKVRNSNKGRRALFQSIVFVKILQRLNSQYYRIYVNCYCAFMNVHYEEKGWYFNVKNPSLAIV